MTDNPALRAELLCAHHSLVKFESGHAESNELARQLYERIRIRDPDDFMAVVAVDAERTVLGIVAAVDLYLVPPAGEQGPRAQAGKWLFYYLLAIAEDSPMRSVWAILLDEIKAIRERRLERDDYLGEVAVPLRGQVARENGLTRFLARQGFKTLEPDGDLWFRPKS
jgi:hypothetical protein